MAFLKITLEVVADEDDLPGVCGSLYGAVARVVFAESGSR
jgi:hypothetical protein